MCTLLWSTLKQGVYTRVVFDRGHHQRLCVGIARSLLSICSLHLTVLSQAAWRVWTLTCSLAQTNYALLSGLLAGYADSTVDLIDALGLEQPDILGWSLGGDICLYIAEFYADMINRVVLADTTSGGLLGKNFVLTESCLSHRLLSINTLAVNTFI